MMPRWTLPCFIFLLLALGGAWSFRGAKAAGAAQVLRQGHDGKGTRAGNFFGNGAALESVASGTWAIGGRSDAGSLTRVATVGAGAAALLSEEIELRALGGEVALSLTEREWAALAGVTLTTQAVRHAYEAEIAVATLREDGRNRLEIPEYVSAGAVLRTEFYSALLKELGESAAMEVMRKLSQRLESRFAGFGAAVQTLDFSTGEWAGAEMAGVGVGSVTRTVVFWNESNADVASRTRSETVFPQLEDPEGAQWGPLLARVEAAQVQGPVKKARG